MRVPDILKRGESGRYEHLGKLSYRVPFLDTDIESRLTIQRLAVNNRFNVQGKTGSRKKGVCRTSWSLSAVYCTLPSFLFYHLSALLEQGQLEQHQAEGVQTSKTTEEPPSPCAGGLHTKL